MNANAPKPRVPRWANQLLRWYCAPHLLEEIEGDLQEEFDYQVRHAGLRKARLDYIRSVFGFIKPFALRRKKDFRDHNPLFNMNMLRHYLVVAIRNLRKNAGYSFINITGLAIGLMAFTLIFLWVRNELSYDRFHVQADRLFRVVENQYYANNDVFPVAVTPAPLAPHLRENFPDIANATRIFPLKFLLKSGELAFNEEGLMTESNFLDMFSFQFVQGDDECYTCEQDRLS